MQEKQKYNFISLIFIYQELLKIIILLKKYDQKLY